MKKSAFIGLTIFALLQIGLILITSWLLTIIVDNCDWPIGVITCSLITGGALTLAVLAEIVAYAYKRDAKKLKEQLDRMTVQDLIGELPTSQEDREQ